MCLCFKPNTVEPNKLYNSGASHFGYGSCRVPWHFNDNFLLDTRIQSEYTE